MDTTTLVASYLPRRFRDNGWQLLDWMQNNSLTVDSLYWLFDTEWMAWRLVLVTPQADSEGPLKVYEKIIPFIQAHFTDEDDLLADHLVIVGPTLLSVEQMRRRYGVITPDQRSVRRLSQDEPYIYCLSASPRIREYAA